MSVRTSPAPSTLRGFAGPAKAAPGEDHGRPPASGRALISRLGAWVLPLSLFLAWELASRAGLCTPYLLPPPAAVWRTGVAMLTTGQLLPHVAASLGRVLAGFALTALLALPLAVLFAFRPGLERIFRLPLEFMRATPPLALVPLLILWLGIDEGPKLAIIVLASFFPIFMSCLSGLRSVDPRLTEMAATLDLTRLERLRFVLVPSALPAVVTGLRLGFGYSWRALIGAELIAATAGLGYLILDAEEMARTDKVFVGILVIGLLGYGFDALFRKAATATAEHLRLCRAGGCQS